MNKMAPFLALVAMLLLLQVHIAGAVLLTATPNPPSLSNRTIDVGQISVANTVISGTITPPLSGNWVWTTTNAPSPHNTIMQALPSLGATDNGILSLTINPTSSTAVTMTFNGQIYSVTSSSVLGAWTFNGYATDSANVDTITTLGNTLTIDPAPTATSLTPSNAVLDLGQYETFNVVIAGGTGTFTANLIYVSGPAGAIINGVSAGGVLRSNTVATDGTVIFSSFNSFPTNGIYTFNVVATDTGTSTPFVFNSISNTVTVYNAIAFSPNPPTLTNAIIDVGQSSTLSTVFSGGSGSLNAQCIYGQASGNTPVASGCSVTPPTPLNTIITAVTSNGMTISIGGGSTTTVNSPVGNTIFGAWTFNTEVTDTGTSTPVTVNSLANTLTINPALSTAAAPYAVGSADQGQIGANDILPATLGGSGTVTYTWLVSYNGIGSGSNTYNAATSAQCAIPSNTASGGLAVYCTTGASTLAGYYYYKIELTDSASTPANTISVSSDNTGVSNTPTGSILAPATNTIDMGQNVIISTTLSGGTGTFTANLVYSNNGTVANTLTGIAVGNTVRLNFVPSYAGTFTFNIVVTDTGTTAPYVFNAQGKSVITVGTVPAVTATPASSSITAGSTQTLTGNVASGTGPFTYQWLEESPGGSTYSAITGANAPAYNFASSPLISATGIYHFKFQATDTGTYPPLAVNSSALSVTVTGGGGGGGGGGGVSSGSTTTTVSTTTATTTVPTTTTIPPQISTPSSNTTVTVSNTLSQPVNFTQYNLYILVTSNSPTPQNVLLSVSNDSTAPPPPAGYNAINAYNVTAKGTTLIVTVHYPCGLPASRVAPYIYLNGAWTAITPFTVNATACTVTFSMPGDPVVGVFETPPATTTSIAATTVATTTIATTTAPSTILSNNTATYAIILIVIIIIIIAVAVAASRKKRRTAKK